MAVPAGSLSPTERLAFCASLAPDIAQVTADFYDPEAPHPYLHSTRGGGTLQREVATRNFDSFAQIGVTSFTVEGFATPERLAERGLPAELSPESVIWSVMTDHLMYPAPLNGDFDPQSAGTSDHTWNYWDGKTWHTGRKATSEEMAAGQSEWIPSTLMPEELIAMRAMTKQVRRLHQVAEVYQGDTEQLEHDMAQIAVDPETRKWLRVAFASALTMRHEVEEIGTELKGYTSYYSTGFQRTTTLLDRIPLGMTAEQIEARMYVGPVEQALAKMYRGSAFIKRDSMRKRAYRARIKGRPLPLPAAW
jgi:hypothetical protein